MDLKELLHKLVDGISWPSRENAAEAHEAVDALAAKPGGGMPGKEGTPS